MARVKGGTVARARRKKVLKAAKGYFGSKHRLYKTAHEQLMHSGQYAYRDRRQNKRNFRKLWIARINAACREFEISYSKFINGLNKAGVTVNRKMLSELAIDNKEAFKDLVSIAKDALNGKAYTPQEGDTLRFALSDGFGKEALVIKDIPINTCVLEIEPNDTKDLKFKTYKYDVQFTSAQGRVSTIILGDFKIDNEVC